MIDTSIRRQEFVIKGATTNVPQASENKHLP